MTNRIVWFTLVAVLWVACFFVHIGWAIFVGVLVGLAASIRWLIGSRSLFRVGLATIMTILAYFLSVSPIIELVMGPRLEAVLVDGDYEPRWYDDYWGGYITPWVRACETEIGRNVLMPYHQCWVARRE